VFFVLSGFLITGILLAHKDSPVYFRAFYAHRALRIFPIYFLLLFAVLVVAPIVSPGFATDWGSGTWVYVLFLSNMRLLSDVGVISLTTIQVLAPTWSLAVEEQFYIGWSVVVRCLPIGALAILATVTITVGIALRCILLRDTEWAMPQYVSRVFFFTFTHLDGLCTGILIRLAFGHPAYKNKLIVLARSWWAWAVLVALIITVDHAMAPQYVNSYGPLMMRVGLTVIATFAGAIVVHGLLIDGWVRRLFELAWLKRLGDYSYCMYLYHWPIAALLLWAFPNWQEALDPWVAFALQLGAVIGFAAISRRWIEAPFLRMKAAISYDRRGLPAGNNPA